VTHDATASDPSYAFALSRLSGENLDHTPIGVLRSVRRDTYDDLVHRQLDAAKPAEDNGSAELSALLHGGDTWTIL
ncbi:MAG: 2-oxoacid:ferredoxin oxidoreductase subunit beta, partial [Stackebrandtia sp.]